MGNMHKFVLVLSVILISLVQKQTSATKHDVGGSQGWDESTDFTTWTSSQTFKVGDQLVFKYTPGLHSVVELAGESAYKSCDISTALDSKNGGNNVIKLDKPGTRYFACGTAGHCGQGMKVKIKTVAATGGSSTDNTTTTTPSSSSSSSSSSSTPSTTTSTSPASTVHVFAPSITFASFLIGFLLLFSV